MKKGINQSKKQGKNIKINGKIYKTGSSPVVINGKTYIPITIEKQ